MMQLLTLLFRYTHIYYPLHYWTSECEGSQHHISGEGVGEVMFSDWALSLDNMINVGFEVEL